MKFLIFVFIFLVSLSSNGQLINQSLNFDGQNDLVDIPDHYTLDFGSGNFSIVCWVKPNSSGVDVAFIDHVGSSSSAR